ncbi:MAG: hypothetical protein ACKV2T_05240 [Kofleriaceae bacterium]
MRAPRILCLVLVAACSDSGSDPDASLGDVPVVACAPTGRYLPLRPGATWSYRVTSAGNPERTKTQTIGEIEDVGGSKSGVFAFRVTTTKATGMVVSWQQDTGSAIVRHRERDLAGGTQTDEIYVPHHTRIDEDPAQLVVGAMWTESFEELVTDLGTTQTITTPKVDTWRVLGVEDRVVVPAGDFCTLRVERSTMTSGAPGSMKTYWFARGIGKIKEQTLTGDTEALVSYTP